MEFANSSFNQLITALTGFPEVEAILLAGSRTTGMVDVASDYDLYVYITREIPVAARLDIAQRFCDYTEVNNQYWETEDDIILREGNVLVEIIYRSLDWLDSQLERVLLRHQADNGYTTCFWANLLTSTILFDRNGQAEALKNKYTISYPAGLKQNIIAKNYPLLRDKIPAYAHQIKKAVSRQDLVSVNHRIAALLASYFDILFAVNALPHPGEKKLVRILKEKADKLPNNFEEDLNRLLKAATTKNDDLMVAVNRLIDGLDELLNTEGINPYC